jgi:outer membrane protein OmpA-like peptidoglycan-associated protein
MKRVEKLSWAVGWLLLILPSTSGAQPTGDLSASGPIDCAGRERVKVVSRLIETDGDGVVVMGACDVEIAGSRIVAGGYAVRGTNKGRVRIVDSHVEGRRGAVVVENTATASYQGSLLLGGVKAMHKGRLLDEGGNRFDGEAATPSTATSAPLDLGGVDRLVVHGDGSIEAMMRDLEVFVDGDYVRLQAEGAKLSGNWREGGSGSFSSADTPRLLDELGAVSDGGEVRLQLAGDVLFDFDSSAVRSEAEAGLRKVAHLVRQQAEGEIYVVGHTDSVGEESYNQKLSEKRAVAVMSWLFENEGIPLALMRGRGSGSQEPVAHNTKPNGSDDPEGRAKNRRVEVHFASR